MNRRRFLACSLMVPTVPFIKLGPAVQPIRTFTTFSPISLPRLRVDYTELFRQLGVTIKGARLHQGWAAEWNQQNFKAWTVD